MQQKDKIFNAPKALALGICTAAVFMGVSSAVRADPVSPSGWTSNIPLSVPLPEGWYFIDQPYGMDRSGPNMAPGFKEIQGAVNIPVLAWSTPANFLGGHLEVIGFWAQAQVGANLTSGTQLTTADFYNPAGLIGLTWNLGNGWTVGNYVGGFSPMNTNLGNTFGLGGNFWTFADLAAVAWNHDNWNLSANFIYLHSGNDINTGLTLQPDTFDVDFAAIKHIDKFEVGLIGSASTDLTNAVRNGFGATPMSQVSLGGLVGYSFGPVLTELMATRSVYARNQDGGGYDTRVTGRITIPIWNPPPPPAPAVVTKP